MHLKKNQKLFPMESLFGIEFQFLEKVSFFHDICHTEYLGPMEETSTPIKLGFHCQVQD